MQFKFDRTTNMAWFVLRQFINPLDCSSKFGARIPPMNKSDALEHLYNGTPFDDGSFYRPSYFSRVRLDLHLKRAETYYYRCRYDAVAQSGYGSYDAAKDTLDFAREMGIEGKVKRFQNIGVMLLGIDIDAHNDEL